jgi:hypothetical protein
LLLSQTCRAAYPIAASYFRVAYNPERFLQQFLPDPPDVRAFRSLQAETGVVVYGHGRAQLPRARTTGGYGDNLIRGWIVRPAGERILDWRGVRRGDSQGGVGVYQEGEGRRDPAQDRAADWAIIRVVRDSRQAPRLPERCVCARRSIPE